MVNQAGTNAQFKGNGLINGAADPNGAAYKFMLWAGDESPDTFRIKIWWEAGDVENVVYDNSVITATSYVASGNMYVQGQGMIVSYDMDGKLVLPAKMPLTHRRYDIDFAWPPECYYLTLDDGRLYLHDGYMRINRNRLDISTSVGIAGVDDHMIIMGTCGDLGEIANPAPWESTFRQLHESEQIITGFLFTPDHWKYTGNQILAEAIFTGRQVMFNDGVATGDTWLVMLHKPGS